MDKKILALGDGVIGAEIATVDTQESYGGGFPLLVTGYLTGKDGVRRTFTQSFFLSPQENGYLVFNDMFLYINEATTVRDPHAAQDIPEDFVQEKYVQENHGVEQSDVLSKSISGPEVFTPTEEEQVSVTEDAPAPGIVHEAPVDVQKVGRSDVPKRSYASIKVVPMSAARSPTKVVEPKRQESQATHVPLPTPLSEKSDSRANGFCFGSVEFESTCSMQSALEIYSSFVVETGNHRGRSAFGVGTGYRNEGGRGRGSCGGGRGRNDFNGYGSNRGNNNRGGYANRANNDGGGFPRRGRRGSGGGIDANRATKHVDAPRVKEGRPTMASVIKSGRFFPYDAVKQLRVDMVVPSLSASESDLSGDFWLMYFDFISSYDITVSLCEKTRFVLPFQSLDHRLRDFLGGSPPLRRGCQFQTQCSSSVLQLFYRPIDCQSFNT
ncbi:hypothetical protein Bca101_065463 [Brassica carinata]